mmetsp:Transcript_26341/g.63504  ORF Transcript_26341/g.63504 Transcript_26341/m.63504 type:complete len:153 (+) Transcript_26341:78-536(+)
MAGGPRSDRALLVGGLLLALAVALVGTSGLGAGETVGRKYNQLHEDVNKMKISPKVYYWAKKHLRRNRKLQYECKAYVDRDPTDVRHKHHYRRFLEKLSPQDLEEWEREDKELDALIRSHEKIFDNEGRASAQTQKGMGDGSRPDEILDEMD